MLGLKQKKKVIFVYAERYKYSGSTIMRGKQLLSIVKKRYGKKYRFSYESISTNHNNSILFLTKGAVTDITVEQIAELRSKNNIVLLDPVDNPLTHDKAMAATVVVAASLEAYDAYKSSDYNTVLVNHHVDIRLKRNFESKDSSVRIGYFGELVNTIMSDQIAKYVHFIHVDTGKQDNSWLTEPSKYNVHYAVRSMNVEAFKPFLKGFTAAACNAIILIQRDQLEALRWLGVDYPYLLNEDPSETDILSMLTLVNGDLDTERWNKAQDTMHSIRKKTSDSAIAAEFIQAIESF